MRCYNDQVLVKEVQIASLPVKEWIREVDTEEEERNHIKKISMKDPR